MDIRDAAILLPQGSSEAGTTLNNHRWHPDDPEPPKPPPEGIAVLAAFVLTLGGAILADVAQKRRQQPPTW